ncbi:LeuA family protein [Halanaerobium sp. MA284_MarDTE_T2]|uniref:LeuA family protein n=1 Tax=Halanaerobium sp. MA284_MarDTE_T2 TaxID=2183913 RepID=UPI000E1794C9|nr:hypothetical protein [Halanaerobium sp. MA284_MarDTE_T2]RCW48636.1 isopropylmalate/homocitrate/citramalate synthase [Halanaerobium sp. MA284_MarDTE_T2]
MNLREKPWKTENWFTSPWNFSEEVMSNYNFSDNIQVHDVTLRDGEQQAGIVFTKNEKVRIAKKLAQIGVHRIEAGMPAVSKDDREALESIAHANLGDAKIFSFARCMKEDVKIAHECGADGIVIEIPASKHIIENAYNWSLEKAVELSIEATSFAKEKGLYTVFFPIDGSRAEFDWFIDLIKTVSSEGHMDSLALVDTLGGLNPHSIPYLINKIKSNINKPLEVHFHDDFGIGAANSIIALASGVDVVHTTITGLGERAGNAPFEDVILSLLTMYNKDLNIDVSKLKELSLLVQKLSGINIRPNRPIVGENIFDVESGIVTSWVLNCGKENMLEYSPISPELVGQKKTDIVFGKHNGLANIKRVLDLLDIELNEEKQMKLLKIIKKNAIKKKRLLKIDEIEDYANNL